MNSIDINLTKYNIKDFDDKYYFLVRLGIYKKEDYIKTRDYFLEKKELEKITNSKI